MGRKLEELNELLDRNNIVGEIECKGSKGLIRLKEDKGVSEVILNSKFKLIRKSYFDKAKEIVIEVFL